jgi:TRAP-type C4-dicarboxylate transport system substrate-binding protein
MTIRLSRRALGGAALAMPFLGHRARAADVTLRIGHVAPIGAPLHLRLLEAAEAISQRSEGRIEVVIGGASTMGVQAGLLNQVRHGGGVEMAALTGLSLVSAVQEATLLETGFLFTGHDDAWTAMDGDLGQFLRGRIARALPVTVIEKVWAYGFRQITNSAHPIQTAADLAGLRLRAQTDSPQTDLLRSLGAVPVAIPLRALKGALRDKQVDGQEGLLPLLEIADLYRVQPFAAMTRHAWDGVFLLANTNAWKQMPERFQAIVANTLNGLAAHQRDDIVTQENDTRAYLRHTGISFTEPDPLGFRKLLVEKGYYARIKARMDLDTWAATAKTLEIPA